jgi:hypothetical protein
MPLAADASGRQPGRIKGKVEAAFFEPLPEAELDAWDSG